MNSPSFHRRPTRYADKPRKVRNGVRISVADWPARLGPVAKRVLDSCTPAARPETWAAALAYAKAGQTKSIEFEPAEVRVFVQEAAAAPVEIVIRFREFSKDQWQSITEAMNQRAVFAASLLAGELPPGIEELFQGFALKLEPTHPQDFEVFERGRTATIWSSAVCCALMLVIDAIDKDPFTLCLLRGMAGDELIDRLRVRREADLDGPTPTGAEGSRLASEPTAEPLEALMHRFWEAGPELDLVETTPRPAEVNNALLRRLGPSPFKTARFPLVGLLATVYEIVSKAALEGPLDAGSGERDEPGCVGAGQPGLEPDRAAG